MYDSGYKILFSKPRLDRWELWYLINILQLTINEKKKTLLWKKVIEKTFKKLWILKRKKDIIDFGTNI